jgi:hypothetical protein
MRFIICSLLLVHSVSAVDFVTNQSGNWTTPATWRSGNVCGSGTVQTSVYPGLAGALDTITLCQNHALAVTSGVIEVGELNGITIPAILVSGSTTNAFGQISVARGATLRVRGNWNCTWNGSLTTKRFMLTVALGGIVEFDSTGDVSGTTGYQFSGTAGFLRACNVSAGADQTPARIVSTVANGGDLQITTSAAQDWQTGETIYLDALWTAPKLTDRLYVVTRVDSTNFVLQGAAYSGSWTCQTQAPASINNCPIAFLPAIIRSRPTSPTNARILSSGDVQRGDTFGFEGQYTVFSKLGTTTVDGIYMSNGSVTGALDSTCLNCRVIDSGRVFIGTGAGTTTPQGAHFDWQNLKVVRPLWTTAFRYNIDNANTGVRTVDGGATGGRRFLRNCAMDGDLGQIEAVGAITAGGVVREVMVDNCFVNGIHYVAGTSSINVLNQAAQFSRITATFGGKGGARWGFEYCPQTNCTDYTSLKIPTTGNSKGAVFQTNFASNWVRFTRHSSNLFGSNQEDVVATGSNPAALLTHRAAETVCLPGPTLHTCGPFTLFGGQPNNKVTYESNTMILQPGVVSGLAAVMNAGETGNTYRDQIPIFRNNLAAKHSIWPGNMNAVWIVDHRASVGTAPCNVLANCDTPVDIASPSGFDFNAMFGGTDRLSNAPATYWNQCQGTDTVGCLVGAGNRWGLAMKLSANAGPNNVENQWPNWAGPLFKEIRYPWRFDQEFLGPNGIMKMPEHGQKPAWTLATSYAVGDEVSTTSVAFGGKPVNWVCIKAHTSIPYLRPGQYSMLESTSGSNDAYISSWSGLTGTFTPNVALLSINNRMLKMASATRTVTVPDNRQSYIWVHALTWAVGSADAIAGPWESVTSWELRVSDVAAGLSCSENGTISGVVDENCWLVARATATGGTVTSQRNTNSTDAVNLVQATSGAEDPPVANANAGREAAFARYWMPRSVMVLLDITSTWNVPEMGIVNENAHRALVLWSRDGMRPTNGQIRGKGFQGRTPGAMEFDGRNPALVGPITQ